MFFHKKLDKNWGIELDDNKQKYRDIYINKITRNIRNYYKNLLERQFNEVNNQHIDTLQKLGLNIPEEEISEDVELSAQLEDELTKLNDTKFKLFKDMQEKLNNVLKHIQSKNKTNPFFEYVIQKYVISERKFPFDFSSEYEKAQQQYNKNLSELLEEFSNIKSKSAVDMAADTIAGAAGAAADVVTGAAGAAVGLAGMATGAAAAGLAGVAQGVTNVASNLNPFFLLRKYQTNNLTKKNNNNLNKNNNNLNKKNNNNLDPLKNKKIKKNHNLKINKKH